VTHLNPPISLLACEACSGAVVAAVPAAFDVEVVSPPAVGGVGGEETATPAAEPVTLTVDRPDAPTTTGAGGDTAGTPAGGADAGMPTTEIVEDTTGTPAGGADCGTPATEIVWVEVADGVSWTVK